MNANGSVLAEGAYVPPTPADMHLPDIFTLGEFGFGKQMLLVLLSVVIVSWFFLGAIRKRAMVPSRTQFIAESGYMFARNSLGKELLGVQHFKPFVPILFTSFFFILVNNLYGSIPLIQLPTFSHAGSAYALAGIAYLTWVGVGIKRHGLGKFFKDLTMPSGVPGWIYPILVPIEFFSNLFIRPVTHALRLFATMFGGHMAIMVAASLTEYLIVQMGGIGYLVAVGSGALGLFLFFLELMIQCIQAYVFALLFAVYLQGSLSEGH
ncbi:MAG: F0F1 ATP synthase subunit A [Rothia sp. (in: high G+C Gram-positive bacteria)]|uniref:F0F1 ATP synthase subunit A n=1 Tax=Rothia sp. (in: high G+C Gram-positive bacteria) TaxID=1885016 RepID=UPI0026E0B9ED|nr:F0F1 ATP synthase subunit A [Rothia sp. (in: high G+C Gram-positive bacteria)]MDO5750774.1 F0F1 ATP synthase subunit A [Rothia sp. (in: high G+C Gram-positive bacteria)]